MIRRYKGFTLIELLAVIVIIGILATIIALSVATATKRARDSKRKGDLSTLKTDLELYNQDKGYYPPDSGNYNQMITDLQSGGYLKSGTKPTDPQTGAGYTYVTDGSSSPTVYVLSGTLEYGSETTTLQNASCTVDITKLGTGVTNNSTGKYCFQVSPD